MATDLDVDQRPLRDSSRSLLEQWRASAELHRIALDRPALDRKYWAAAADAGWLALLVPEQAGGGSVSGRAFSSLAVVADKSVTTWHRGHSSRAMSSPGRCPALMRAIMPKRSPQLSTAAPWPRGRSPKTAIFGIP